MMAVHLLATAMPHVPPQITEALETEFTELESRYFRGDWTPAEMGGGRFAEAVLRFLEWRQTGGTYTPIGTQLNRTGIVNAVSNDARMPEGLRFQALKLADVLLDFRNKRDVAHLGAVLHVDEMDSRAIMRTAAWILAEIIREEGRLGPGETQKFLDRLSRRRLPLVEEVGGDLVVVATELKASQRILVALYRDFPAPLDLEPLRQAVGYQNPTRFLAMLHEHRSNGRIHMKTGKVYLTSKGAAWVDLNIPLELTLN